MKNKIAASLLVSLLAIGGSAFAASADSDSTQTALLEAINANLQALNIQAQNIRASGAQKGADPTLFCYHEGKPFSEGAKFNGQTCTRAVRMLRNTAGQTVTDDQVGPLYWDFRK